MRLSDDHHFGVDIRREDELGWRGDSSVDISTQKMDASLVAMHKRLLERATNGRLTWRGDQITKA